MLFFLELWPILSGDFSPFGSKRLDNIISVFFCDDLLALLPDLLGHLSSALQQSVEGLLNGSSRHLHQLYITNSVTFGVFDLLILGAVDLCLDVIGVLPSLVQNWCKNLVGVLSAHLEHLRGSILQGFPPLLGFRLQLGGLSRLDLGVQVISCFFDASLEVPSNCSEYVIEELAGSGDDLLDVIRIVNLLLL